jgi:hypothetical protein
VRVPSAPNPGSQQHGRYAALHCEHATSEKALTDATVGAPFLAAAPCLPRLLPPLLLLLLLLLPPPPLLLVVLMLLPVAAVAGAV